MNINLNESNSDYHASKGLSFSGLKYLAKTPAHYLAYLNSDHEETSSQRLGTLTHMAILEPERFEKKIMIVDGNRNANAVKEAISAAEARGLYVAKSSELTEAIKMRDCIYKSETVRKLFSRGVPETSLRCIDPTTGVLLKARPDWLRVDEGIIVDVKTFTDLDDDNLMRQINKMKYHWQSWFYLHVLKHSEKVKTNMFVHLFIDTKAYVSKVVVLDDAALEKAEHDIMPLIQLYADCLKNNDWPGYEDKVHNLSLPHYAW